MQQNDDIYAISGRVKNIIAKEDIPLSPVGTILVNYFSLMLKDLYDFAETLDETDKSNLKCLLKQKESVPLSIIRAAMPKDEYRTIYEEVMHTKESPQFKTNREGLEYFTNEYKVLTEAHGLEGDEFWAEAESSSVLNQDHVEIMRLARCIQMCEYLIKKYDE
jgi:hypothetical protein